MIRLGPIGRGALIPSSASVPLGVRPSAESPLAAAIINTIPTSGLFAHLTVDGESVLAFLTKPARSATSHRQLGGPKCTTRGKDSRLEGGGVSRETSPRSISAISPEPGHGSNKAWNRAREAPPGLGPTIVETPGRCWMHEPDRLLRTVSRVGVSRSPLEDRTTTARAPLPGGRTGAGGAPPSPRRPRGSRSGDRPTLTHPVDIGTIRFRPDTRHQTPDTRDGLLPIGRGGSRPPGSSRSLPRPPGPSRHLPAPIRARHSYAPIGARADLLVQCNPPRCLYPRNGVRNARTVRRVTPLEGDGGGRRASEETLLSPPPLLPPAPRFRARGRPGPANPAWTRR